VIVGRSEDAQVVAGSDSSSVFKSTVSDRGAVVGDGSLLDIVAGRRTSEKPILANDGVDIGGWALE